MNYICKICGILLILCDDIRTFMGIPHRHEFENIIERDEIRDKGKTLIQIPTENFGPKCSRKGFTVWIQWKDCQGSEYHANIIAHLPTVEDVGQHGYRRVLY